MSQQPSVNRAVHYVSHGTPPRADGSQAFTSQCRAATVTEVGEDETVGLCVVNPTGFFFYSLADGGVPHEERRDGFDQLPGGTWHWPERV